MISHSKKISITSMNKDFTDRDRDIVKNKIKVLN